MATRIYTEQEESIEDELYRRYTYCIDEIEKITNKHFADGTLDYDWHMDFVRNLYYCTLKWKENPYEGLWMFNRVVDDFDKKYGTNLGGNNE